MQKVCKKAGNIDKILSIKVNNALPDAIKKSYKFDILSNCTVVEQFKSHKTHKKQGFLCSTPYRSTTKIALWRDPSTQISKTQSKFVINDG